MKMLTILVHKMPFRYSHLHREEVMQMLEAALAAGVPVVVVVVVVIPVVVLEILAHVQEQAPSLVVVFSKEESRRQQPMAQTITSLLLAVSGGLNQSNLS